MDSDFSILVVEDNDDARRNMEDILSLDGHKIRSESHCLPAIEAINQDHFDLVIVDWRLPDQNADSLIPLITDHQPGTPVVVVTGMRDFDTAVTALRSGAHDFLLKPVNPDHLRSVVSRVVERKKHLVAIKEAQQKLLINERLAAIGQMVTGLAHESRNAFQRSHACLAELSLDLEHMPESLKLVAKVQKALDDLHGLLEEVRDYSAPIILERRWTEMSGFINSIWEQILEAKQPASTPHFQIEIDDDFPDSYLLDPERMGQVMRNLIENAIHACGRTGRITVHLRRSSDPAWAIRIEVVDNGSGVSEEDRETIFQPFFTTKTKGTGLGLAISSRYVDAHRGRMFVESEPGAGARFVIELPPVKPPVVRTAG